MSTLLMVVLMLVLVSTQPYKALHEYAYLEIPIAYWSTTLQDRGVKGRHSGSDTGNDQ